MRILFVGDIMGRSGREALEQYLPHLKRDLDTDVVIVNGENAANGAGITKKICAEFYDWGADCITTGNHVWAQREILGYIANDPKLLRPVNLPQGSPGHGAYIHTLNDGRKILIINAMGRLFMDAIDDPFRAVEDMLITKRIGPDVHAIFVDFHAEATSEKYSFGHYFDGRVSAVVGTHTHIPTNDAHIMKGGTAFLCDAGMTGDYDSIIGVDKGPAIHRFTRKTPTDRPRPAKGGGTLCGVLVVTDDNSGKAVEIIPVKVGGILGGKPKN